MIGFFGGVPMIPKPPRFFDAPMSPVRAALRSCPAENVGPFALMIATHNDASSSNLSINASSCCAIAPLNALRASGRSIVITKMWPSITSDWK